VKNIIQRILDLEVISRELEPPESKRNAYNQQIQNYANSFINDLEISKAYSDEKVKQAALSITG